MELSGTGIWSSHLRYGDAGQAAEAAAELEELGYPALWIPDVGGPVLESVENLLTATKSVTIATGILNLWMHDPAEVAATHTRLQAAHGGRFLLGIGVSHAPLIDSKAPGTYRKPLAATAAFLDGLDNAEQPVPATDRVLAALGPKMLQLSADRSRVDAVSIPRDTLVDIPECTTLDGGKTEASEDAPFNSAFANGAGSGSDKKAVASGAACTLKTVETLTNVRIDDFIVVDFTGLSKVVDSLGGVHVQVDEAIDDSEYTGFKLAEGCQKLDGENALQYARVRHGVSDGSDPAAFVAPAEPPVGGTLNSAVRLASDTITLTYQTKDTFDVSIACFELPDGRV